MAWLNAVPTNESVSRLERYENEEISIGEMPQCDAFYIVEYLQEIGIIQGDSALTHSEIRAWMNNTGIDLKPWECRFIKKLSVSYLGATHQYKTNGHPAPFDAEYFESADRYIKSQKSRQALKSIVENK